MLRFSLNLRCIVLRIERALKCGTSGENNAFFMNKLQNLEQGCFIQCDFAENNFLF